MRPSVYGVRAAKIGKKIARFKARDFFADHSYVALSPTGAELLFEVFSQRYERGSMIATSNLPFDEWTGVFGSERLTGALLDRLTHYVHILEMNGGSFRLRHSQRRMSHDQPPPEPDKTAPPRRSTT